MAEGSVTWKVAVLGAVAALVGSAIGAGTTVYVNDQNESHRDAERLVLRRENAYKRFLAEAQREEASFSALRGPLNPVVKWGGARGRKLLLRSKRLSGLPDRRAQSLSLVLIYGDSRAANAALRLDRALTDASGSAAVEVLARLGPGRKQRKQIDRLFDRDLRVLDRQINKYTVVVRSSLRVPFD